MSADAKDPRRCLGHWKMARDLMPGDVVRYTHIEGEAAIDSRWRVVRPPEPGGTFPFFVHVALESAAGRLVVVTLMGSRRVYLVVGA